MALADFINSETQEIRPIEQSVYDGWVASGNPKALVWSPYVKPPEKPPSPPTVEEVWQQKLAGRITDPVTGIQIEANEGVRNILTGQLTMTMAALSVGAIQPTTPQDIWDADGAKHTLATSDLIALILRHGAQWQAMFAEFAP